MFTSRTKRLFFNGTIVYHVHVRNSGIEEWSVTSIYNKYVYMWFFILWPCIYRQDISPKHLWRHDLCHAEIKVSWQQSHIWKLRGTCGAYISARKPFILHWLVKKMQYESKYYIHLQWRPRPLNVRYFQYMHAAFSVFWDLVVAIPFYNLTTIWYVG